jgi:hypothetical protein
LSAPIKTYGAHAIIATSGMSRALSAGTPGPVCQVGFVRKISLTPPPLASHPLSIPPGAMPTMLMSLPRLYCGENVVPPTAVTCGLAAISLGFLMVPVTHVPFDESYCRPAAPQSPEAIKTDCPWVAACANNESRPSKKLSDSPQ